MSNQLLDPRIVRLPGLPSGQWLNASQPLSKEDLRGKVILFDFWDYTCVYCLRTLPYLREWYQRYASRGLLVIGIHTPEFKFAGQDHQVAAALQQLDLTYPILLDPEHEIWSLFANRAWPSRYIADHLGYIRFRRQGEGYYRQTEEAIQILLRERDPDVSLPELMPMLRDEDEAGAICYRTTPELYSGYQRGGLFGNALGNSEGYVTDGVVMYRLPDEGQRHGGQFYLEGFWRAWPESVAFAGQDGGRVLLPYSGSGVNAVLSPSGDNVEVMLDLRPTDQEPLVEVRLDGNRLLRPEAGADVWFAPGGRSYLRIDRPRLYEIVRHSGCEEHELELIFHAQGLALYTFTFNTAIVPEKERSQVEVFKRP